MKYFIKLFTLSIVLTALIPSAVFAADQCCRIIKAIIPSYSISVSMVKDEAACKDICLKATGNHTYCYHTLIPNAQKIGNDCISATSGCCMVEKYGIFSNSFFAGRVNSQTECNLFCQDAFGCTSKFYKGLVPNSQGNTCTSPSTPPSATPNNTNYGAGMQAPAPIYLTNPLNADGIAELIGNLLDALFGILGAIALLMFFYGGFRWLTAAGNDASVQAGKDTILWASIAVIIIFTSYILVGFLIQLIGAS